MNAVWPIPTVIILQKEKKVFVKKKIGTNYIYYYLDEAHSMKFSLQVLKKNVAFNHVKQSLIQNYCNVA